MHPDSYKKLRIPVSIQCFGHGLYLFIYLFLRVQTTPQSIVHLINISEGNYVKFMTNTQGFQCFININIDVGLLIDIVFSVFQLKYFPVGICQIGEQG